MVHQRAGVVVGRHLGGALPVGIDDASQLDVPELGVGQEMILAHVPGAHDAGAQLSIVGGRSHGHYTDSLSGVAVALLSSSSSRPDPARQIPRRAPAMKSSRSFTSGAAGSSSRIRSTARRGESPLR